MALLRQCLKLQRERAGAAAQENDFPPVDAQTLAAMRLAGREMEPDPGVRRDTALRQPGIPEAEPMLA